MLDVKKTLFESFQGMDNPPLRIKDINTREHFLIQEIYYQENGWGALLLLQDNKGYYLVIDYPDSCADDDQAIIEVVDTVLPYEENLATLDIRDSAYEADCEVMEEVAEARVRLADQQAKQAEETAAWCAKAQTREATMTSKRNTKRK